MLMTGQLFHKGDSLTVNGDIDGVICPMVVDTGANVTVVRPDVLSKMTLSRLQGTTSVLKTATGETANVRGKLWLGIKIGGTEVSHETLVAEISNKFILGLDFLMAHGCTVDAGGGSLRIGVEEVPLHKPSARQLARCYRLTAVEDTLISPYSETLVAARIMDDPLGEPWGTVGPSLTAKLPPDVMVGKTLVDAQQDCVPVRVVNLSGQPREICQGTEVASCEPVESVIHQQHDSTPDSQSVGDDLPEHLKDLYTRSNEGLNAGQKRQLHELLLELQDIFSKGPQDLGKTGLAKHEINTGDALPVRQYPRRLPLAQREEAFKAVENMHKQGIIEPSVSPWASPVVLVKKKDGFTRFCVDYRKLNDLTKKDSYPLPRIDSTLDELAGSTWFSTLDLKSGYWQVEVEEKDREKTAFSVGNGLWQYNVMAFGLCNAPATFERLMENVLGDLRCLIYLDDVIVHGSTFEQELERLRLVFSRLRAANLKLNPKKCELFQRKVKFLGHVVCAEGVTTDPDKVEAVKNWPVPRNAKEVRRFVGLCTYYRRFVRSFSDVARPLHELTEKGHSFQWTKACEDSFQQLKDDMYFTERILPLRVFLL